MSSCHTNRSVKLPSFRHFQDQFLTTNKRSGGRKMGLCFARFVFLTFRGPLASHDSNPYPNRSRIARYNAEHISATLLFATRSFEPPHLWKAQPSTRECLARLGEWLAGLSAATSHTRAELCSGAIKVGRNEHQSSKDEFGLPPSPRILWNLWVSAGGFWGRVLHRRRLAEERSHRTPKVLQNFGSQSQLRRPCKLFSQT